MLEAGVENLFHAVHFGSQRFFGGFDSVIGVGESLIDMLIHVGKSLIHAPFEIGQTLVVDQKAQKNREGGQSSSDGCNRRLERGTHFPNLADCRPSGPGGFFEMLEAGVENLFHTVHFGAQRFFGGFVSVIGIGESLIHVEKTLIHAPFEIGQALVVDQKAHKDREGGQSSSDGCNRQLERGTHFHNSIRLRTKGKTVLSCRPTP